MANDVPTIPLYSRPNPLIWKSAIRGHEEQPRHRRLRLEHRGVALEVVSPLTSGAKLARTSAGTGAAPADWRARLRSDFTEGRHAMLTYITGASSTASRC